MEGSCSTGKSPQWAVVPVEEEDTLINYNYVRNYVNHLVDLHATNRNIWALICVKCHYPVYLIIYVDFKWPIPVVARSKA
jgi:hypothetical protein